MKRVLVQEDLAHIKNELTNRGYELVDMDTGQNIEAIVYMSDGINSINQNLSDDSLSSQGAILVNANGKSVDDIDSIISNKVYSPLNLGISTSR